MQMASIHLSDKIDFKLKALTKDKGGHHIMIKGSIHREDRTIVNIYLPISENPNVLSKY